MANPNVDNFNGLCEKINCDVYKILYHGNHLSNERINKSLKHLNYGTNNIRLDHEILSSSEDWLQKCGPRKVSCDKQGATQVLNDTAGVINFVKNNIKDSSIETMIKTEVRDTEFNSANQLRDAEWNMAPFAHHSIDRLKQYCDHVGVTDRYTGYRHNLNRGSRDPVRLGYSWLDQKNKHLVNTSQNMPKSAMSLRNCPPGYAGNQTFQEPTQMPGSDANDQSRRPRTHPANIRSLQERCGINTVFPGNTVYMKAYPRVPPKQMYDGHIVNPTPDYSITKRPMAVHRFEKKMSEYQHRYIYPDGRSIVPFPWLRK